ncbi:MAG: ABC transporter substrate-binding protein [Gammaproteobacteria bacterium]|nr:ABC transporter substrate-binding protein [Gammaproteobacteria bacterium]
MRWLITVLSLIACGAAQAEARRVVALAPHLAELVCAAGGCARLVAVSAHSDFPPDVGRLPQVGDGWQVNLEAVLAQRPDLIVAWDGGTPVDTIARLRKLGLRVEALPISSLDGVAEALTTVGAWLGTEAAAKAAASAYRQRLAALRAAHRGAAPLRVVYQIETAPAYTVNGKSPISEAMAVCGGVNVFAALPTLAAAVSAEAMLVAAPDVVFYGGEENSADLRAYWARLGSTPAAKRGALYPIDADRLARAGPRLLDGIEQVCTLLDQARAAAAAKR